jgi:KTSC domain
MDPTLISVDSSAIRAVGYDGWTLTVEFCNGRIYDHPGVPYSVYQGLMQASSKGAYYNHYIRGKYR